MIRLRAVAPLLGMAIAVAACAKKDAANSTDTAAAMSTPSGTSGTGSGVSADDKAALLSYRLDMNKMRQFATVVRTIGEYQKSHPGADVDVSLNGQEDLDASAARIDADPVARDALRKAGISAREYVLLVSSYIAAGMSASMMEANPNARLPSDVSPENVEFVRTHKAELQKMGKDIGMNESQ
jgi:hypothetical protein